MDVYSKLENALDSMATGVEEEEANATATTTMTTPIATAVASPASLAIAGMGEEVVEKAAAKAATSSATTTVAATEANEGPPPSHHPGCIGPFGNTLTGSRVLGRNPSARYGILDNTGDGRENSSKLGQIHSD